MALTPHLVDRAAIPYVGRRLTVTMATFGAAIDAGFPALFAHVAGTGAVPSGAPLIRYHVIDMENALQVELGVPVAEPATTAAEAAGFSAGVVPAGRYACVVHTGPYDGLVAANAALQSWAAAHDLRFAMTTDATGEHWRARIETYLTNPAEAPDPTQWQTEIAYLLDDSSAVTPAGDPA